MSAYIMHEEDINYLINGAVWLKISCYDPRGPKKGACKWLTVDESPDYFGQILWDENHKSVSYRYAERTQKKRFTFKQLSNELSTAAGYEALRKLVELVELVFCYEYQSCEHKTWERSWAYHFCVQLKNALLKKTSNTALLLWQARPVYQPVRAAD